MRPWATYPAGGLPIWDCLGSPARGAAARDHYEERAAIMEHDGGLSRGAGELFAYAFLVRRLHLYGVVPREALSVSNVATQLDRARRIDRDVAFSHGLGLRP